MANDAGESKDVRAPGNSGDSYMDGADWFMPLDLNGADFSAVRMDAYFKKIASRLKGDMEYLRGPIVPWRNWSLLLRIFAFLFLALAVLLPLPLFEPLDEQTDGLELGYVSALLGGLLLFADQVFGISSSWMRLTLAEMELKQIRYRLELEWARRRPLLTDENAGTEGPALIDILKTALDGAHDVMQTQKVTWTTEIRQGMEALRSRLNDDRVALERLRAERLQERSRPKTGALNITFDKPADLKGPLEVKVAGQLKLRLTEPSIPAKISVNDVPAGLQTITVSATHSAPPNAPFLYMVSETVPAGEAKSLAIGVS